MTFTFPTLPAGETAISSVSETKVTVGEKFDPKATDKTFVKLDPDIVTRVPPAWGPPVGDTFVTTGNAFRIDIGTKHVNIRNSVVKMRFIQTPGTKIHLNFPKNFFIIDTKL
jgi:hypothetical protein